jgi:hypothetical protein
VSGKPTARFKPSLPSGTHLEGKAQRAAVPQCLPRLRSRWCVPPPSPTPRRGRNFKAPVEAPTSWSETAPPPRAPAAPEGAHRAPQQARPVVLERSPVAAAAARALHRPPPQLTSRAILSSPPPSVSPVPLVPAGRRGGGGGGAARSAGARPRGLCVGRADAPDPGEAQRGGGAAVRRGRGGRRRRVRRRRGRRRVRRRGRRRRGRRARQLAVGVVAAGAHAPHQQRLAAALVRPQGQRAVRAAAQGAHAVRVVAGGARGGPHRQGGAQNVACGVRAGRLSDRRLSAVGRGTTKATANGRPALRGDAPPPHPSLFVSLPIPRLATFTRPPADQAGADDARVVCAGGPAQRRVAHQGGVAAAGADEAHGGGAGGAHLCARHLGAVARAGGAPEVAARARRGAHAQEEGQDRPHPAGARAARARRGDVRAAHQRLQARQPRRRGVGAAPHRPPAAVRECARPRALARGEGKGSWRRGRAELLAR